MSNEKALEKIGNKYLCMVSGQKRMEPCDGCSNPKGCLSRAMQYKETEEMDQQEEKAILKVSADGDVVSCAKGMEAKECGYKGGKVCGACGAMAVQSKDSEDVESDVDESEIDEKAMPMAVDADMSEDEDDEDEDDESEDMEDDEKGMGYMKKPMKKKAMAGASGEVVEMEEEDDDEDEEDEEESDEMAMKKKAMKPEMSDDDEDMEDEEEEEEDAEPSGGMAMKPTMEGRNRAIKRVAGKKSVEMDLDDSYICQFERKAYPNSREVCANCPGGCVAEQGMPGIADVEGMALDMFGGKVLASGYTGTEEDDFGNLFVVDIMSKDGHAIEIIADGDTGELLNFHRLNTESLDVELSQKSLEGGAELQPKYVSVKVAEEIALSVVENEIDTKGLVVQADSDIFEGFDSWVFEIDAVNGKSYDVYVALDGHVLGYDEYDQSEAEDIEAEAAEIALKRAYSDEQRDEMAKGGMALPDGSYPIKDEADLRNAIQAYGRAKDKEKAKRHIMKRAMDLGKEELIPMNWVPKKDQDTAKREEAAEKADDEQARLLKDLLEFEMLTAEEDLDKFL